MKKSTNKYQENYMAAKALLETLNDREKEIEQKYISDNKIVNSDGEVPDQIYCIDNEEVFDKANSECAELPELKENFEKILTARAALKVSEEKLVQHGLSIIPSKNAHEKEVLTKAAKENYTTRLKIIDLVLKLDARTVRA